jgi:hypothetical protein
MGFSCDLNLLSTKHLLFNGAALARSSGGWTHRLTKQLDCALMVVLGLAR